jgi:SM-20-related protein
LDLPFVESPAAIASAAALPRGFLVLDGAVDAERQQSVNSFLNRPGWNFGWKSNKATDSFAFWHKHFAGNIQPDHLGPEGAQYDCVDELKRAAPLLRQFWEWLSHGMLAGHRLVRCYANGQPFGAEGTLHTDSVSDLSFTTIYYPHEKWDVNWGGETLFFNREKTDIIAAIYPRPNRLLMFPGTIPHVARGVARICPVLRITLMFKTELAGE